MAKHAAEVVEKLTTQVEELKSKIMQIDELKIAHASTQATLEQMQASTQGMFQQMLLQMQTLTASVSTKTGELPKPEVSLGDKPPENKIPQVSTVTTTIKEKKGELFPFCGENSEAWLQQAERYFTLNEIKESERMRSIMLYLDGPGLDWFMWTERNDKIHTWQEFRSKLDERWNSCDSDLALEKLMDIKQGSTIMAYRTEFERLSSQIPDLEPKFLERVFLKGLTPAIRYHMDVLKIKGLSALMDAALKMEKQLHANWHVMRSSTPPEQSVPLSSTNRSFRKPGGYNSTNPLSTYDRGKAISTGGSILLNTSRTISLSSSTNPSKRQLRLTDAEFQARKDKGLCFHCDDKFSPGHKCKKQLNILLVHDEEMGDAGDLDQDWAPVDSDSPEMNNIFTAFVSCNSVHGLSKRSTMKLQGKIQDRDIVILIDPGATHNFICGQLAEELNLPLTPMPSYRIVLGDGPVVFGKGKHAEVSIITQGIMIIDEFLPLTLSSIHVILGKQWLDSIGWVHQHFRNLIMKFIVDGQVHVLQGDPNLHRQMVDSNSIDKETFMGSVFMAELYLLENVQDPVHNALAHASLSDKLQARFQQVFQEPKELPPPRDIDHAITLIPNAPVVNQRPYQYSYDKKNEVEKLVKELLAAGIIQYSKSPYASPILLVKKRDASWRICVDYRALNRLTIPD